MKKTLILKHQKEIQEAQISLTNRALVVHFFVLNKKEMLTKIYKQQFTLVMMFTGSSVFAVLAQLIDKFLLRNAVLNFVLITRHKGLYTYQERQPPCPMNYLVFDMFFFSAWSSWPTERAL